MTVRCPMCGSSKIEERDVTENDIISKGLPENFVAGEWVYYICKDCMEKEIRGQVKDFVFTFVEGKVFRYLGKPRCWVEFGMTREEVQFT